MRIKLLKLPRHDDIDDLTSEQFHVGGTYDLDPRVASMFLAEGWADVVRDDDQTVVVPVTEVLPFGGTVLVVDDDSSVRQIARILLSHSGYDVLVARNGRDALDRMTHKCPDLILLDLHMPELNGWQFRSAQRRLPPPFATVPVVLLTGEADADACAAALDALTVVKKPFSGTALLDAVHKGLCADRGNREAGGIDALTRAS